MNVRGIVQILANTAPQHARRRPLRTLLTVITISVAVALFVSMRITQGGLLATFNANLRALAGGADYTILGPGRVPPDVLKRLDQIPGVHAAPLVTGSVTLSATGEALHVFGIDVARDPRVRKYALPDNSRLDLLALLRPDAVVIPSALASANSWQTGSIIKLRAADGEKSLYVAGILADHGPAAAYGGNILFLAADAARRLLGHADGFTQLDLTLDNPALITEVRTAIPVGFSIRPALEQNPTFAYLYRQFQMTLVGVSVLSTLIGAFVVYNAVSLSVVERSKEIATLRALGARRTDLLLALTLEAALVGAIASIIGCLAGQLIAGQALQQVGTTLKVMLDLGPLQHNVPFDVWPIGLAVGLFTAILGAALPAYRTVSEPPVAALKPGEMRIAVHLRTGAWLLVATPLLVTGIWLIRMPNASWNQNVTGVALAFLGLSLTGPAVVLWLLRPLSRLAMPRLPLSTALALQNLADFPTRTSLTVVTLGGCLALVVAVSGWLFALQRDLDTWMRDIFAFDLSIQLNDLTTTPYPRGVLPGRLLIDVRRDPQVAEAYGVRYILAPFRTSEVMIIAYDTKAIVEGRISRGISNDPAVDRIAAAALRDGAVGISSNFASLYHVKTGDRITLSTPLGPCEFPVTEVRNDYSWVHGVVMMDLDCFRRLWNDDALSYVDIRVRPNTDLNACRADLARDFAAPLGAFVHRADEIRAAALRLTGDWFRLADVQLLLALFIGGVGVANTLLISVVTQSRQIALLRAIGASAPQIRAILLTEAAALGLFGAAIGCILGLVTIRWVLNPISIQTCGVALPFAVPYAAIARAVASGLLICLVAALLPLRAVRRLDLIAAIGYE